MERKWYVPPFFTHGKAKKPTQKVSKGTIEAFSQMMEKISIWFYMDNFLVFILDTCWGGTTESFVCRDKVTGKRKYLGDCPKALNEINNKMFGTDCCDLIQNTPSRCMDIMLCPGPTTRPSPLGPTY
eukprot:13558225-Ditylum_brightwellii.AAC.1